MQKRTLIGLFILLGMSISGYILAVAVNNTKIIATTSSDHFLFICDADNAGKDAFVTAEIIYQGTGCSTVHAEGSVDVYVNATRMAYSNIEASDTGTCGRDGSDSRAVARFSVVIGRLVLNTKVEVFISVIKGTDRGVVLQEINSQTDGISAIFAYTGTGGIVGILLLLIHVVDKIYVPVVERRWIQWRDSIKGTLNKEENKDA